MLAFVDMCSKVHRELEEKGYAVVEDVLTEEEVAACKKDFYNWLSSSPQIMALHHKARLFGMHERHS